jgi:hypothetical protein
VPNGQIDELQHAEFDPNNQFLGRALGTLKDHGLDGSGVGHGLCETVN